MRSPPLEFSSSRCMFDRVLISPHDKVFSLTSTGEGLVSGGADGYVKVGRSPTLCLMRLQQDRLRL